MKVINIAREFSPFPVGRFYDDGPDSGERFRDEHLEAPLKAGEAVKVELSGVEGYGSSFLDEAFGGIVRKLGLSKSEAEAKIILVADEDPVDQSYLTEIKSYIADACRNTARK